MRTTTTTTPFVPFSSVVVVANEEPQGEREEEGLLHVRPRHTLLMGTTYDDDSFTLLTHMMENLSIAHSRIRDEFKNYRTFP